MVILEKPSRAGENFEQSAESLSATSATQLQETEAGVELHRTSADRRLRESIRQA